MLKMIRTSKRNGLEPGQTVSLWNGMPDQKRKETYQIVKLVRCNKADSVGEYEVEPVNISKDLGNLIGKDGKPSYGLR